MIRGMSKRLCSQVEVYLDHMARLELPENIMKIQNLNMHKNHNLNMSLKTKTYAIPFVHNEW